MAQIWFFLTKSVWLFTISFKCDLYVTIIWTDQLLNWRTCAKEQCFTLLHMAHPEVNNHDRQRTQVAPGVFSCIFAGITGAIMKFLWLTAGLITQNGFKLAVNKAHYSDTVISLVHVLRFFFLGNFASRLFPDAAALLSSGCVQSFLSKSLQTRSGCDNGF